ncbi:hypothetical protein M5X17_27715 [Paenibacillus alvei]|uniref:hypothetical protein n=1 Tax=Paenibacillus alvei TaxID=44250 RepID=UPI0022828C80|nr:hypothetical protein [Paenibacillus alvei]MCY9737494.1 hypothetical protein [Paenibacillus alvei]
MSIMTNQEIARRITHMIWYNDDKNSDAFAVQLFTEHLLLSKDKADWDMGEMYMSILNRLNALDSIKGTIQQNWELCNNA